MRVGDVVARDDERGHLELLELLERVKRPGTGHLTERPNLGAEVAMLQHPLAGEPRHGLLPVRIEAGHDELDEPVDAAVFQGVGQAIPARQDLLVVGVEEDRPDHHQSGQALRLPHRVRNRRVCAH